jgi:hypothetical protein
MVVLFGAAGIVAGFVGVLVGRGRRSSDTDHEPAR